MSRIISFNEFKDINEDVIVAGFGPSYTRPYSMSSAIPITGYSLSPVVGYVDEMSHMIAKEASMYESNDNPKHTAKGYLNEAKKHINKRIDEIYETQKQIGESNSVQEAEKYEFDAAGAEERLKKREEMNLQRFRAAQDRKDNYSIELYQLRIKMDKIDREKLKLQIAIQDLKKQFGKDE